MSNRKEYHYIHNRLPHVIEAKKKYVKDNLEKVREAKRAWKKRNPDKVRADKRAYQSRRKAKLKSAIPKWFDGREVASVFLLAQQKGLVVDHLVPLNSEKVCGLHVQDNLRCITEQVNMKKGNRYWPDMWPTEEG